jgi:hypothetical protein
VNDSAQFKRSQRRLERLRAKYPDWNYVDCEQLEQPTFGDVE